MDKFSNLPSPIKWFVGVTGIGLLLGAGGLAGRGGWKLLGIFALVLIVLLLIVVGGFLLWNYWQRKKQNARLRGELQQSTTAAPRGMSATDLAKLDSLRKKFQEGIEAYRSRGKDLYTLPWYVIIGEPGSGKTEAIRHCNVGFPPGMHEGDNDTGYMGAGGTINMNWWFTNQAVMLDTAGRLVFEEVKPGETSEWKEFLKLLKKNRPNRPINGLLLVIPSDSLIKDSADQIAAKAGKIAQQLDVIQRVLDFRFPVYVAITKSDKINGFREFFEGMTDPQLQHQMLGWSNPEPLDSPFKPDLVDKHLTQVSERLRRRRLGLMRDPVPETASRRVDEVDSLFALPSSLLMLAPRLRRYLETIFMPGEWSAKPLFLRGIYFTSSMREGASLDQELAEAIGVAADELPEGKVWERERAYFLRDLFVEKVFREKGLVTRATNTRALVRRRRLILYASSFVALTAFVIVAWLGMRTVRQEVKNRGDYWAAAANVGWSESGLWNRSIVKWEDEGGFSLVTNKFQFAGEKMTLGELHAKLRELAENDIQGRWTSPRLAETYNNKSKQAQRVIFETGVLKPLRDAVEKTIRSPASDAAQAGLPEALAYLIRLESDVVSRSKGDPVEMDSRAATAFLGVSSRFVTVKDASLDTNLVSAIVWTYTSNKFGQRSWPPAWLSSTITTTNGVVTNATLQVGIDHLIRTATNTMQTVGTNWMQVTNLQVALRSFGRAEQDFLNSLKSGNRDSISRSSQALKESKAHVDSALARAAKNDLFKAGVSFSAARQAFTNQIMTYAWGAFEKVEKADTEALKKHMDYPVFVSIANRLKVEKNAFSANLANIVSASDLEEFSRFDDQFLGAQSDGRSIDRRSDLYERAAAVMAGTGFGGFPLLRESTQVLPVANVDAVAKTLQGLADDLKPESIQNLKLSDTTFWKTVADRVNDLKTVALFLKGKEGGANLCSIKLRKVDDAADASQKWRFRYRGIRLSSGSDASKPIKIESDEDQDLGQVAISKPCAFQLFQLTDDKTAAQSLGDSGEWGPLALILKYQGKPEKEGDFKTWIVQRPLEGSDGGTLPLKLVFDDPLPDPKHWPAQ